MSNACFLCGLEARVIEDHDRDVVDFTCPRCGRYEASEDLATEMLSQDLKGHLSPATRRASDSGLRLLLSPDNYREIARAQSLVTIDEKITNLLRLIATRSGRPGRRCRIVSEHDCALIGAADPTEFDVYLTDLEQREFLQASSGATVAACALSVKGWRATEPSRQPGGMPGTCFVAMSFDPLMSEAYEVGIESAIRECGFRPLRIDRKEHNNQITDEIMAGIRDAQFVIADFTGHRAGVYYEAGFARGLGREVVHCCRRDSFNERHFDTSVINHIVWDKGGDLRTKLIARIKATILPKA